MLRTITDERQRAIPQDLLDEAGNSRSPRVIRPRLGIERDFPLRSDIGRERGFMPRAGSWAGLFSRIFGGKSAVHG
jgi:hypothetical protein